MKLPDKLSKYIITTFGILFLMATNDFIVAQTNTFPSSGNVGIGTTSPTQKLYVVGNTIIGVNNIDSILNGEGYFQSNSTLAGAGYIATPWIYARAIEGDQRGSGSTLITLGSQNGFTGNDEIGFVTSGVMRMLLDPAGNFGIGTTNPTQKLTVNGITKTEEVIVTEDIGADFVFDSDYKLPDLSELELYIQSNRHLPGIPTAYQMIEEGVKVGDLQMKLLQKIEELTLYMIELKKIIDLGQHTEDRQNEIIESLLKENRKLAKKINQLDKVVNSNETN